MSLNSALLSSWQTSSCAPCHGTERTAPSCSEWAFFTTVLKSVSLSCLSLALLMKWESEDSHSAAIMVTLLWESAVCLWKVLFFIKKSTVNIQLSLFACSSKSDCETSARVIVVSCSHCSTIKLWVSSVVNYKCAEWMLWVITSCVLLVCMIKEVNDICGVDWVRSLLTESFLVRFSSYFSEMIIEMVTVSGVLLSSLTLLSRALLDCSSDLCFLLISISGLSKNKWNMSLF